MICKECNCKLRKKPWNRYSCACGTIKRGKYSQCFAGFWCTQNSIGSTEDMCYIYYSASKIEFFNLKYSAVVSIFEIKSEDLYNFFNSKKDSKSVNAAFNIFYECVRKYKKNIMFY